MIRLKRYSIRTEHAYVDWIRRFIWFHGKRHPNDLEPAEVESFLTDLAVARGVAASTPNQAKSALLFLYKEVLGIELPWLEGIEKARVPMRLPVVLTREETKRVLERLHEIHALIGRLLYGTGMRVMEGMRLRVKDLDFARREILIRDGKGYKDRVTVLPRAIESSLREQLEHAGKLHRHDLAAGFGGVWLCIPAKVTDESDDVDRMVSCGAWRSDFRGVGHHRCQFSVLESGCTTAGQPGSPASA